MEAVDEIENTCLSKPLPVARIVPNRYRIIPADMGNTKGFAMIGQTHYVARHPTQTFEVTMFRAMTGQELHTKADPEKGATFPANESLHDAHPLFTLKTGHSLTKGTHAWQHNMRKRLQPGRMIDDLDVCADSSESVEYGGQVSHPIVDDSNSLHEKHTHAAQAFSSRNI